MKRIHVSHKKNCFVALGRGGLFQTQVMQMLCFEAANMAVPVLLPDLRLLSRQSFGMKVLDERFGEMSWLAVWLVGLGTTFFLFGRDFLLIWVFPKMVV